MESAKAIQAQLTQTTESVSGKAKTIADNVRQRSVAAAKDRRVQATVASAAGGTVFLGFCGGAVGLVGGGLAGAAVGVPFVLFTFGLSIPFFATVGGGFGGAAGVAVGGAAGCTTGGAAGFTIFAKREQIANAFGVVRSRLRERALVASAYLNDAYGHCVARANAGKDFATYATSAGVSATTRKTSELAHSGLQIARDPQAQVTAASAAAGGVALGVSGGTVGLVGGGIVGAAVGIVPALFTFGLSIPLFAILGGGSGLCLGTAVGSTVGTVGGGAVGHGVYGKRSEIRTGVSACVAHLREKSLGAKPLAEVEVQECASELQKSSFPKVEAQEVAKELQKSPVPQVVTTQVKDKFASPAQRRSQPIPVTMQAAPVMQPPSATMYAAPTAITYATSQATDAQSPKRGLRA